MINRYRCVQQNSFRDCHEPLARVNYSDSRQSVVVDSDAGSGDFAREATRFAGLDPLRRRRVERLQAPGRLADPLPAGRRLGARRRPGLPLSQAAPPPHLPARRQDLPRGPQRLNY